MSVLITKSKPNPAGKDLAGYRPLAAQLLGEWVDVQNTGSTPLTLVGVHLANERFAFQCIRTETKTYWDGATVRFLGPGQTVRIHTGRESDSSQMNLIDRLGADIHAFANSGEFILNNGCGDTPSLWLKQATGQWAKLDSATYSPRPQDGKILHRLGDRLL